MTNEPDNLRDKVLSRIQAGKVHMRPKAFFVAQVALMIALCAVILGISVFIANYVSFMLRIGGHQALLSFGSRGLVTFLLVIPWEWLALDVLLIVFTAYLLRRFRWGYRHPAVYVAALLLLAALALGFFVDEATPFNEQLLRSADRDELPGPLHDLYEHAHAGPPHDLGIYRGIVSAVGTSTLTLTHDDFDHDEDDGSLIVIPPARTDVGAFQPGDRLYVAGSPVAPATIQAYGIEKLSPVPGQ